MTDVNEYYQKNAQDFFRQTLDVDMDSLRSRFLVHILNSGRILDAGCGSGRDTKGFLNLGYQVKAFDASSAIAELAEVYLGKKVDVLRLQNISYKNEFDGVWACASLLHIPQVELPNVFLNLFNALKSRGILYASFKYGSGENDRNGRRFTDMDEAGLALILEQIACFDEIETWISGDQRQNRENELWLNTLLRARKPE